MPNLQDAMYNKYVYTHGKPSGAAYLASTAVAGVAPGTALSTTPPFALWNPTGGSKYLVPIKIAIGYVSGTLGAGSIVLAQVHDQVAAPTTGTELTVRSARIGMTAANAGRCFQGSTVASTPLLLRPFCVLGASLASTAALPIQIESMGEQGLAVSPGTALVIQGVAAAGTSPLVLISVTWEEIPI